MNLLNKNVLVRSAELCDLDEINNLLRLSKGSWGYTKDYMDKFMEYYSVSQESIHNNTIKVFLINKKIIGFYSLLLNKNTQLYLEDFFVHPDHMNQGLGKIMWLNCLSYVESINQNRFTLWADVNSIGFYKKMGCIEIELCESKILKNTFAPIMLYKIK